MAVRVHLLKCGRPLHPIVTIRIEKEQPDGSEKGRAVLISSLRGVLTAGQQLRMNCLMEI